MVYYMAAQEDKYKFWYKKWGAAVTNVWKYKSGFGTGNGLKLEQFWDSC